VKFYVGLHQPSDAKHFERAFISVNRLRVRTKPLGAGAWIMDSGAFTELSMHGKYRASVDDYAAQIARWRHDPTLKAVVAQDYMCEPFILSKTGLTVREHQRLTIERFTRLRELVDHVYVMPVLQGYLIENYLDHIDQYDGRLPIGAYVGVGSVCKRNADPKAIELILDAIKNKRPDLRLHGFGLKTTALGSKVVRHLLHSSDSMAWSFAARWEGRNRNSWMEAKAYADKVEALL
jgi:hypothetical protein